MSLRVQDPGPARCHRLGRFQPQTLIHTPHPAPHTPRPTSHTPHPTPHTPHPTPLTPHPTPHTPHPTPHTPHPTPHTPHPTPHTLVSQKVFMKMFCKSQFPHKSVNVSCIITNIKNEFTDLCGKWPLQNDFISTLCEINTMTVS